MTEQNTNAVSKIENRNLSASGGAVLAVVPQDFNGAYQIAQAVCTAGMAPAGLNTPEKACVAILHGMEVGMTPMVSLQSIAVINGRPSIWGDGAMALIEGSGKLTDKDEFYEGTKGSEDYTAVCTMERSGKRRETNRFSVADAKKAGLWGKQGPWQQYPDRMLKMRARAFTIRDLFSDVLRGLSVAEEMRDVTPDAEQPQSDARSSKMPPPPPSFDTSEAPVIENETSSVETSSVSQEQASADTDVQSETPDLPQEPSAGVEQSTEAASESSPSNEQVQEAEVSEEAGESAEDRIKLFDENAKDVTNLEDLEEMWNEFDFPATLQDDQVAMQVATGKKSAHERRIKRG